MRPDEAVEKNFRRDWDRLYMRLPEPLPLEVTQLAAEEALRFTLMRAPRMTGTSAGRLTAFWGADHFGIRWLDNWVWFQEMGIRAFVMNSLQGKTIPMWVEDADGSLRQKNPKAKSRTSADGRVQVLIFRRAANKGERKTVKRRVGGREVEVSVPRSYPGAPGRINRRGEGAPRGRLGGQILAGNVGVRWRHPGLTGRFFIQDGILLASRTLGLADGPVHVAAKGEVI